MVGLAVDTIRGHGVNPSYFGHWKAEHVSALRDFMTECTAAVIFGVAQLKISEGQYRAGQEQAVLLNEHWSSPWCQIEAGMALALDIPILIVKEPGIREGIFDPTNWIDGVVGTTFDELAPDLVTTGWLEAALARSRAGSGRPN